MDFQHLLMNLILWIIIICTSYTQVFAFVKSMSDHCCPPGALPSLVPPQDYVQQGVEQVLGDLPVYVVGSKESKKAVIVGYDVYGFHGGRIRNICDEIANAGFFVVLPDFLRGKCWTVERELNDQEGKMPFIKSVSHPDELMSDFTSLLLPFLREQGLEKISFAGFCFGGYVAFLFSQLEGALSCAASAHSSIRIFNMHGSNENESAKKVTCPQMILQASNDNANGKPGSEVEQILSSMSFGDKCVFKEFPDMLHGWVPRGDLADEKVQRDVAETMMLVISFMQTHMA